MIVRATHEAFDGSGYPDGLAGAEIPLAARIIAVCDTYSAITSDRPYKAERGHEEALAELRAVAGSQLDPDLVELFCATVVTLRQPRPGAACSPARLALGLDQVPLDVRADRLRDLHEGTRCRRAVAVAVPDDRHHAARQLGLEPDDADALVSRR